MPTHDATPTLTARLENTHPTLRVSFDPSMVIAGVHDVQINGESILDEEKVANIVTDDSLQYTDNKLGLAPSQRQSFIALSNVSETGTLTPEQLAVLQQSPATRLASQNNIYTLAKKQDTVYSYYTNNVLATYNEIVVDLVSGNYQMRSQLAPSIQEHITNTVIHVTAADRNRWDDKVSATVEPTETINDYILKLVK